MNDLGNEIKIYNIERIRCDYSKKLNIRDTSSIHSKLISERVSIIRKDLLGELDREKASLIHSNRYKTISIMV